MVGTSTKLLLTVGEVAEATGYSKSAIHLWIAQGKLPGVVRIGRTVRLSAAALSQFIVEQASKSA